jgi:N-hydroxyarylamine O-acetyltransferase
LLSVPFENLDIHMGRPIILDQRLFYKKIVDEHRGGYCYELNGCFAWLLTKLGFRVAMLSARVAMNNGVFSPEFDHMTLLVRLGACWLADVGFGDSFTEPKRIDEIDGQKDGRFYYKITPANGRMLVSRRSEKDVSWTPQYAFTLRARRLADFAARNRYQQTSPHSHFTKGRLISKLTTTGRATLTDRNLILTRSGKRVERSVKNQAEFDRLLAKYFGLTFSRE